MRHFAQLTPSTTAALFEEVPGMLGADASAVDTGGWLGAVLYVPGSRPDVLRDAVRQRARGVGAVVIDFEDSMPESEADAAVERATGILAQLVASDDELPLVFLRMRSPSEIDAIAGVPEFDATRLSGFVFPKFHPHDNAQHYFAALERASDAAGRALFAMPIVEAPGFAHRESRGELLTVMSEQLDDRTDVACVRIGGTDLASTFGLRRSPDSTIYDMKVVADVIADVVNTFGRSAGRALPVSGTVWEHFPSGDRLLKPQLRETPFAEHAVTSMRRSLVQSGLDSLLSEINLDRLNGLSGKTVIHPDHVALVHALSVVSHEDHADARLILDREADGGVHRSSAANKMNEVRPHLAWARRVVARARSFGVARPDVDFVDFLVASQSAA